MITRNRIPTNKENCKEFIRNMRILSAEIAKPTSWLINIHNILRMYSYLNDELENFSSHLKYCPDLKSLLIVIANKIPEHIIDIISLDRQQDISVTWHQRTGLNLIENVKIVYNLRICIKSDVNLY
jgi:hypothetical protein